MNDPTAGHEARTHAAPALPHPLLPRPEDSELARRARAATEFVAGFSDSARLDNRFCQAVRDLARAITGLEGMGAVGLAPELAEETLAKLSDVLVSVEVALERARPELEAERRTRPTSPTPTTRRRGRPKAAA